MNIFHQNIAYSIRFPDNNLFQGKECVIFGCVPLPEWTGMNIITGLDYRNGHYAMALGALNIFYLHKMYLCSHMNSLHKIKFISV